MSLVSIRMRENKDHQMTIRFMATLLFCIIAISASQIPETRAIPEYVRELPEALKSFCQVCHVRASGGPLNSFGDDFASYGRSISAVGDFDSDDDGFSNDEELASGSLPGDPESTPTNKKKKVNPYLLMGGVSVLLIVAGLVLRKRATPAS